MKEILLRIDIGTIRLLYLDKISLVSQTWVIVLVVADLVIVSSHSSAIYRKMIFLCIFVGNYSPVVRAIYTIVTSRVVGPADFDLPSDWKTSWDNFERSVSTVSLDCVEVDGCEGPLVVWAALTMRWRRSISLCRLFKVRFVIDGWFTEVGKTWEKVGTTVEGLVAIKVPVTLDTSRELGAVGCVRCCCKYVGMQLLRVVACAVRYIVGNREGLYGKNSNWSSEGFNN